MRRKDCCCGGGDELGVGSLISRRIQDGLQNPTKGSSVIIRPGVHPGKLECWKGDEPVTGRERLVAGEKDKGRCIRGSRGLGVATTKKETRAGRGHGGHAGMDG